MAQPRRAASQSGAGTHSALGRHDGIRALAKTSHYWDTRVVRQPLAVGERPVHWVGSSKRDFFAFPEGVKDDMGNALGIAQFGGTAPSAKPWKGLGAGVLELSPSGVRTARTDVALVARRLKAAQNDYEALYGKPKR